MNERQLDSGLLIAGHGITVPAHIALEEARKEIAELGKTVEEARALILDLARENEVLRRRLGEEPVLPVGNRRARRAADREARKIAQRKN